MRKTLILILAAGFAAFTACEKDNDSEPKSKTSLLTSDSWKMTTATVDPAIDWDGFGTMVTNIFSQMPACSKDDIITFKSNGTYVNEEGPSKCDPSDPDVIDTGTWTFNSDESKIVINDGEGSTMDANIVELTKTTMKITYDLVLDVTYTFTETYSISK